MDGISGVGGTEIIWWKHFAEWKEHKWLDEKIFQKGSPCKMTTTIPISHYGEFLEPLSTTLLPPNQ